MTDSKTEAIAKAFREGKLFVHMFEFRMDSRAYEQKNIPDLFRVMSGQGTAPFKSDFHEVRPRPEGFVGLPTTAIKETFPVGLWSLFSNIGILMDGNSEHVKPLFVGSEDVFSITGPSDITVKPNDIFPELAEMQQLAPNLPERRFRVPEDMEGMCRRAGEALPRFWEIVAEMGWDVYKDSQATDKPEGMNEVVVAAHARSIAGILIYSGAERISRPFLEPAGKLREWLLENHADIFPDKEALPIMSYSRGREKAEMTEVTQEILSSRSHRSR